MTDIIWIDLYNIVPGAIIEVPSGLVGHTRRVVARQVYRDHASEMVCVMPHTDNGEWPHMGHFTQRVRLVGLDANGGGDDSPADEINGGDLSAQRLDGPAVVGIEQVPSLMGEINHTLRESADQDTLDIVEDASRAIILGIGLTPEYCETPDGAVLHAALDIIGMVNATALADIVAATRAAYPMGHGNE